MAMSIGQLVRPPFFVQAEILQQPLSEMWFRHAMLAEDRILDFNLVAHKLFKVFTSQV